MHKRFLTIFTLILYQPFFLYGHIVIHSLYEARAELKKADKNTVVLFDIDETLTVAYDEPFLRKTWQAVPIVHQALTDAFQKHFSVSGHTNFADFKNEMWTQTWAKARLHRVDNHSPELIKSLQKKHVKTIAFSSAFAGIVGTDKPVKEIRFEQLKNVGIRFDVPELPQQILLSSYPIFHNAQPTFYRGILLTNNQATKGEVLIDFFDKIGWHPTHVIFFDDVIENLDSVSQALIKRNIPCTTFFHKGTVAAESNLDANHTITIIKQQLNQLDAQGNFPPFDAIERETKTTKYTLPAQSTYLCAK
jgi:hypothetical protein